MSFKISIVVFGLFFLSSCGVINDFKGIFALKKSIQQKFGQKNVELNIHNFDLLTVSFRNTSFNALEEPTKKALADNVRTHVLENIWPDYNASTLRVEFVNSQGNGFVSNFETRYYLYDISKGKDTSEVK